MYFQTLPNRQRRTVQNSITKIFTDQLGRRVDINYPPQRIISLVPSQTELLYDLGLKDEVVGITKFCIHPEEWYKTKKRVGGTKKIDLNKIQQLQPDLIIGNKEENEKEQIEELMDHYTVWMSDIKTLGDAYEMIKKIGEITGRKEKATKIIGKVKEGFNKLKAKDKGQRSNIKSAAYLIWKGPYLCAGGDTFINEMLNTCGFKNVFAASPRYPEITKIKLQKANPDLILLSSEPFPFKEKHIEEIRAICPRAKVVLVDGEMFSWYGSRLIHAPAYFLKLTKQVLKD